MRHNFDEPYLEWARANVQDDRDHAAYSLFALAAAWRERGEELHAMPPLMGWALAERPQQIAPRGGYRLERADAAWMKDWQAKDLFTNALGQSVQAHRTFRNKFAYVLFDASGEPAAVAGAYDSAGPIEIGVDVAAAHRGRSLAPVVVRASARGIVDEGATPYYACSVTNIRSQGTALASGFRPACSAAIAVPGGMGLA